MNDISTVDEKFITDVVEINNKITELKQTIKDLVEESKLNEISADVIVALEILIRDEITGFCNVSNTFMSEMERFMSPFNPHHRDTVKDLITTTFINFNQSIMNYSKNIDEGFEDYFISYRKYTETETKNPENVKLLLFNRETFHSLKRIEDCIRLFSRELNVFMISFYKNREIWRESKNHHANMFG